ncbi:MAG: glycosidase [Bradymonadia bacterium]|jgi:glycosidase
MNAGLNDQTWNLVNRLSMGFLFVLTQPGVPLIYYGDEIGLYGGGDPDNRRMMPWGPLSDAQLEVRGRVQAVGQARQDLVALRRGRFQELWVDDNFFVYARVTEAGEVAIVAMNKGGGTSRAVPNLDDLGLGGVRLVDRLGGSRTVTISGDGNGTFTLNSWEYAIFVPE